jgi:haloalkane dehalogenase
MHALYESLPVVEASDLFDRFSDKEGPPGFLYWRKFCAETPELHPGDVMGISGLAGVADDVRAAYEAPFPDQRYVAGARKFPSLVPVFPDDPEIPANRKAWETLAAFDKPFLTAFSDGDPVTAGLETVLQERVAGARGREHPTIADAGHFLQEDQGEAVAAAVLRFIAQTP